MQASIRHAAAPRAAAERARAACRVWFRTPRPPSQRASTRLIKRSERGRDFGLFRGLARAASPPPPGGGASGSDAGDASDGGSSASGRDSGSESDGGDRGDPEGSADGDGPRGRAPGQRRGRARAAAGLVGEPAPWAELEYVETRYARRPLKVVKSGGVPVVYFCVCWGPGPKPAYGRGLRYRVTFRDGQGHLLFVAEGTLSPSKLPALSMAIPASEALCDAVCGEEPTGFFWVRGELPRTMAAPRRPPGRFRAEPCRPTTLFCLPRRHSLPSTPAPRPPTSSSWW
jgi:hypothetical protein